MNLKGHLLRSLLPLQQATTSLQQQASYDFHHIEKATSLCCSNTSAIREEARALSGGAA